MTKCSAYMALDVHEETIAVAVAHAGRCKPGYRGAIRNCRKSLMPLVKRLSAEGERPRFCYAAGPCGYALYRGLVELGHACEVVAPSQHAARALSRADRRRRPRQPSAPNSTGRSISACIIHERIQREREGMLRGARTRGSSRTSARPRAPCGRRAGGWCAHRRSTGGPAPRAGDAAIRGERPHRGARRAGAGDRLAVCS
jgi:hypothetical protein